jgi:predicted small integral membrane protein
MIPGCKVFFQGALFGIVTFPMLALVLRGEWAGAGVLAAIWLSAMWFGLDNAFRLLKMEPRS